MELPLITYLGRVVISLAKILGSFVFFLGTAIKVACTERINVQQLLLHMKQIGVDSCTIIFLTGLSAGLALALQTNIGFSRFGIEEFIGTVVALGLTRELG